MPSGGPRGFPSQRIVPSEPLSPLLPQEHHERPAPAPVPGRGRELREQCAAGTPEPLFHRTGKHRAGRRVQPFPRDDKDGGAAAMARALEKVRQPGDRFFGAQSVQVQFRLDPDRAAPELFHPAGGGTGGERSGASAFGRMCRGRIEGSESVQEQLAVAVRGRRSALLSFPRADGAKKELRITPFYSGRSGRRSRWTITPRADGRPETLERCEGRMDELIRWLSGGLLPGHGSGRPDAGRRS